MLTSDLTFTTSSSEIPLRENRPEVCVTLLIYDHDDFDVTEMDPLSAIFYLWNRWNLSEMLKVSEIQHSLKCRLEIKSSKTPTFDILALS